MEETFVWSWDLCIYVCIMNIFEDMKLDLGIDQLEKKVILDVFNSER